MKRFLALILALAMCFSFVACDKKADEKEEAKKTESVQLELGSEFESSDAKLTLTRVRVNSDYSYYEDSSCVEMIFSIVNNGKKELSAAEILTLEATVSGEKVTDVSYLLSSEMTGYNSFDGLSSGAKSYLFARVYIPSSENEVSFRIKADGAKYLYTYTMGNDDKIVTPISFNTSFTVDGIGDFTITKLESTASIRPTMGGSGYGTITGNVYVDTVFTFTNTSSNAVDCDDIIKVAAKCDSGASYTGNSVYVETSGGTSLSSYESISPLVASKIHAPVSVSEAETAGVLEFDIGGNYFTISFDVSQKLTTASTLNVGNVIGTDNSAKASFLSCEFVDAVYPSITSGYYSYYKVDDPNNIYLALAFDVTNYGGASKEVDDMIYASAKFAGKYTYNGFSVSEDDDKESLSAYNDIDPLETKKVYFLISVPKTVMTESYEVTVAFDGVEYLLSVTA